jgi:hypothetical protein
MPTGSMVTWSQPFHSPGGLFLREHGHIPPLPMMTYNGNTVPQAVCAHTNRGPGDMVVLVTRPKRSFCDRIGR